jgi:hypothetical protein
MARNPQGKKFQFRVSVSSFGGSAAADEVDDLQAVFIVKFGGTPALAREDVEIQFDGDAVVLHAEVFDERGDGERVGKLALLAVDLKSHQASILTKEFTTKDTKEHKGKT